MRVSLSRRTALSLLASASLLPLLHSPAPAAEPGVDAIILSDLHSAYERMGQILHAVETRVKSAPRAQVILINGDVFELGNVVGTRSGGAIDWAFLAALAKLAPTVLNIGNHEPDFDNDLARVIEKARGLGVTVVSNIIDKRTGKPYTEAGTTLSAGGVTLAIAALGTPALFTYPKPTRELIEVPEPVSWAAANLAARFKPESVNILLSHAGVTADRAILPSLPDGTLLVGGHDHLTLLHEQGATRYVHTGSWGTMLTIATLTGPGKAATITRVSIPADGPVSDTLKELIPATLAKHLTDEERAVVAKAASARPLGETARFTASAMAKKAGADIGFIGHTSFGAGLPQGDISRYAYNAALRFDGKIMMAEIDAAVAADILSRCNQDGDIPLAARTGDFLYGAPALPAGKDKIRIVCNDWSAMNKKSYFGREDITFTEVPELKLKALVADALQSG